MAGVWDDLGGRPLPGEDPYWTSRNAATHRETYTEALARSIVGKPQAELSEQQQAERLVESRERMRKLDGLLAHEFISPVEQVIVSRTLAKKLGYHVGDDRATGQPDIDDQFNYGDND